MSDRAPNRWPLLPGVKGETLFTADRTHRLWLSRWWSDTEEYALHIGMNPSTAGADTDDLTVRKDQEFTRRMGLHRMFKCNIGTFISTDPTKLPRGADAVHPDNRRQILNIATNATRIIVATGKPPDALIGPARALFTALRGRRIECFGLTADHWPKHSSRLAYATPLQEFVW